MIVVFGYAGKQFDDHYNKYEILMKMMLETKSN